MTAHHRLVLVVVALLAATSCGHAPPPPTPAPLPDEPRAVAEELVHRSGLQTLLLTLRTSGETVTQILLQRWRDERGDVSPEKRILAAEVGQHVRTVVDDLLLDTAIAHLEKGPLSHLQGALAHFRDPRADLIALSESAVATGSGQILLSDFLARLRHQPARPTRRAAAEQLVTASASTELYTALSLDASNAMLSAVGLGGGAASSDDLTRFADEARRHLVSRTLFVYRDLDDEVLRYRLDFYIGAAGRWWAQARLLAARAAVAEVAARVEQQLQQKGGLVSRAGRPRSDPNH